MKKWLVILTLLISVSTSAWAAGNLAARAERLPELEIRGAEGFSVTSYEIETGKFYLYGRLSRCKSN